jgi:serine/threonine protein kinase/tetratricopeptide (TPR) repeat protein
MGNSRVERQEPLPARVGPFEIVGVLGQGGMGVVYSARRPGSSDRVAVKTVPVAQESLLSSMRREIHALGRLAHPGVVRILDSGIDGGRPWYAMELLDGTTLGALRDSLWVSDGPTERHAPASAGGDTVPMAARPRDEPPIHAPIATRELAGGRLARVLTVMRRLLGTLAFVHGEGIVHRDIKPQNVFLRDGDQPVLVDFGMASRSAGIMGREVLDLTLEVVGTPAYMAPEQIWGIPVDSRGDLYAIGCVLYELLTGRPPFLGSSSVVMLHHLQMAPRPPSELVAGCPRELDQLVLALLEKRPRDRIGHAEDVMHVLDELGAEPEPLQPRRARAYVYRPELAGREAAMNRLDRAARDALRGAGGLMLIAGESGVGKTYLAMEAARATHGFQIVAGTCALVGTFHQGPGGPQLHPFARLLQLVADRCTALGRAAADHLLGARGKILAEHEPGLAQLPGQDAYPDPPPLHGTARRDRLLVALADTLAALAEQQPLLLVLDDLQWADDVSLRLLTGLGDDWFTGKRILVIGTYRVEEATPGIGELLDRPYTRSIELGSLDEASVGSLISDMLAIEAPPDALVGFLARHSEGNPFFVAEYLRTATAEGLLRRGRHKRLLIGRAAAAGDPAAADLTELALPLTMPELVGRRLDGLAPAARDLARYASVIGREVDAEVLHDAAGVSDVEALEGVAELIARQVLEPTDAGGLRFVHDKLCEIAYDRQDPAVRRAMHRAVAEAIERRVAGTDAAPRFHAVLAHHYLAAEVDAKAIEYLEQAGERALAVAAYAEAVDLHRKLLALDDRRATARVAVPARRRARWERRLGEACANLGDLTGCEAASLAAMRLLGRRVPTTPRGRLRELARMIGRQALHRAGIGARGGAPTDDAVRGDKLEIALAASAMAYRYFFVDDLIGLASMSLLAVNESETASPRLKVASAYARLGFCAGSARMHRLARSYFAQAQDAARVTGDTAGKHLGSFLESLNHICFARWADCETINRAALVELRDAGDPTNTAHHLAILAFVGLYVCRFDESADHWEQLRVAARTRRNQQHEVWGLFGSCLVLVARGRFDEALPRLHEAKAILDRLSDVMSLLVTLGLYTQIYVRSGRDAEARRMADEVSARIEQTPPAAAFASLHGYAGAAEAYLELADRARRRGAASAGELLGRARVACARLRRFSLLFPFAGPAQLRYRAQLAALEGDRRTARRRFDRAIELSRRLAMPYDEAQALWLASRYVPDPARTEAARAIFARLGCAWHLAQLASPPGA